MQQQQQSKDPANMKLFGKTIPLILTDLESYADYSVSSGGDCEEIDSLALDRSPMILKLNSVRGNLIEDPLTGNPNDTKQQVGTPQASKEDSIHKEASLEANDNTANPSMDEEKGHNHTTDSQDKQLKRPDKLLPCPRCKSMDTKFCYYNNYNVLQPRHFCKSCQRYWTSGGTMRNVPVGAGRRRNRIGASLPYHHIAIPEALASARNEASNVVHGLRPPLNYINGTVQVGNGEDLSTGSSVTVTNSTEEMGNNCVPIPSFMPNFGGYAPHFQYMPPGFHWPYPWNPQAPPTPFFHPGMPMPFYPPTYMNAPWSTCPTNYNPYPQTTPNSTTLGKHSRDCEEPPAVQKRPDRSVWVPKTLRFDDPEEAAKSSIWKTNGIKNNSISKGGIFKAFQPKHADRSHVFQSSPLLLANPAALSRSVSFRESF